MANEAILNIGASATKNGATISISAGVNLTISGDKVFSNVQKVGSVDEAVLLGDTIAGAGTGPIAVVLSNLDPVNSVSVGIDGTYRLALGPLGSTTILSVALISPLWGNISTLTMISGGSTSDVQVWAIGT